MAQASRNEFSKNKTIDSDRKKIWSIGYHFIEHAERLKQFQQNGLPTPHVAPISDFKNKNRKRRKELESKRKEKPWIKPEHKKYDVYTLSNNL